MKNNSKFNGENRIIFRNGEKPKENRKTLEELEAWVKATDPDKPLSDAELREHIPYTQHSEIHTQRLDHLLRLEGLAQRARELCALLDERKMYGIQQKFVTEYKKLDRQYANLELTIQNYYESGPAIKRTKVLDALEETLEKYEVFVEPPEVSKENMDRAAMLTKRMNEIRRKFYAEKDQKMKEWNEAPEGPEKTKKLHEYLQAGDRWDALDYGTRAYTDAFRVGWDSRFKTRSDFLDDLENYLDKAEGKKPESTESPPLDLGKLAAQANDQLDPKHKEKITIGVKGRNICVTNNTDGRWSYIHPKKNATPQSIAQDAQKWYDTFYIKEAEVEKPDLKPEPKPKSAPISAAPTEERVYAKAEPIGATKEPAEPEPKTVPKPIPAKGPISQPEQKPKAEPKPTPKPKPKPTSEPKLGPEPEPDDAEKERLRILKDIEPPGADEEITFEEPNLTEPAHTEPQTRIEHTEKVYNADALIQPDNPEQLSFHLSAALGYSYEITTDAIDATRTIIDLKPMNPVDKAKVPIVEFHLQHHSDQTTPTRIVKVAWKKGERTVSHIPDKNDKESTATTRNIAELTSQIVNGNIEGEEDHSLRLPE